MGVPAEKSFLAHLLTKYASVLELQATTGKRLGAAVLEVRRQIKQATRGNPITGKGVTKSGRED